MIKKQKKKKIDKTIDNLKIKIACSLKFAKFNHYVIITQT